MLMLSVLPPNQIVLLQAEWPGGQVTPRPDPEPYGALWVSFGHTHTIRPDHTQAPKPLEPCGLFLIAHGRNHKNEFLAFLFYRYTGYQIKSFSIQDRSLPAKC